MLYVFLVIVASYSVIKITIKDKINFFEIVVIIFLLLASRPSSIPIVSAIIFFITIYKLKIFSLKKKYSTVFIRIDFVNANYIGHNVFNYRI